LWEVEGDQADRGWSGVAGTGVGVLFDPIAVVSGSFDHAGIAAVASFAVEVSAVGDVVVDLGDEVGDVLRGKGPPDR
jgi:hypothetical protein